MISWEVAVPVAPFYRWVMQKGRLSPAHTQDPKRPGYPAEKACAPGCQAPTLGSGVPTPTLPAPSAGPRAGGRAVGRALGVSGLCGPAAWPPAALASLSHSWHPRTLCQGHSLERRSRSVCSSVS